ncbi:MAG TPA: TIGR03435 family protein [Bryobacteraceae bacterium]|jgi:uncharacterized protein (TIGR03435 family)
MGRLRIAVCLLALTIPSVPAQEFEAASIKPHPSGCMSGPMARSGIEENAARVLIENMSLKAIIQMAYGVRDDQFTGPGWLGGSCFDVVAKPPAGYTHNLLRPLLQRLLSDRFGLAVHRDSKDAPAYALVSDKSGSKVPEAAGPRGYLTVRPGLIEGKRRSMFELVNALAKMLQRPVVDETGLTSAYDIKLEWTPDTSSGPDAIADDPGPSLSTALHEQLGLRLQSRKVPVDRVTVDRVARTPTEN